MTLHPLYVHACDDLLARADQLLVLRFILPPILATCFGILDGIRDARLGDAPYLWRMLVYDDRPVIRVKMGWFATARVLLFAVACDVIQQRMNMIATDPIQMLWTVFALAYVPYVVTRGATGEITRIVKRPG